MVVMVGINETRVYRRHPTQSELDDAADRRALAVVLPVIRRVAIQRRLDDAEYVLARAAYELLGGSRIYVHYVRPDTGTLWTLDVPDLGVPIGGLGVIAFAAQVGEVIALERIAAHPLYLPEIDDPLGSGAEPALLAPIVTGAGVLGVLTVVREPGWSPFTRSERALLRGLTSQAGPLIGQFLGAAR